MVFPGRRRAASSDAGAACATEPAGSAVARLFTGHAALVAHLLDVLSGIGADAQIDVDTLREFCEKALHRYGRTDQDLERSLTVGFLATALELLHRAGHDVPLSDLTEQRAAWTALRDQHAPQMPR